MPPGDGFRIPITLDFSGSIANVREFKTAVGQAFNEISLRARSASESGAPLSVRSLRGAIGRLAGEAQAQVLASGLDPTRQEDMLGYIQRQVQAQVSLFRRQPAYEGLKEPSEAQIAPTRAATLKRLEAARGREVVATEKAAAAQEKLAGNTARFAEAFGLRGIPTPQQLQERTTLLRQQAGADPNVFQRLGRQAGIGREFGLRTGIAEERDEVFKGAQNQQLRLELTILRRIRELEERSAVEQAVIANEQMLLRKTAELNVLLEQRQLAERAATRAAAGTELDPARASERLAREQARARQSQILARETTPEVTEELGRGRAAERARRARIDAAAAREVRAREEHIASLARAADERKREARDVNQHRQREAAVRSQEGATFIQRRQAAIATRAGGPPRDASEFLTGRQLIQSRLLTTASFAASGVLLYSGVRFARELVKEASELQVQLGIVRSQLISAGQDGGAAFSHVREEILRVSRATGIMADEVASVTRQLAGAFASVEGVPDFERAITEATSAFKLSRVTGLPQQEITDSLTAVSLAFGEATEDGERMAIGFEGIGDTIIGLEQRFGVLAPEIVKFTADLAPLGAELGFTVTQLSALGAVAQQVSGRTGTVLAEQFGRILPALADRSGDLLLLFQENARTAQQIPGLARALAQRDLPEVLTQLVRGYDNFNAAQRNTLVSLVGSRREAAAFYSLLTSGEKTIKALQTDPGDFEGFQERRFEEFSQKVQFAFEQAGRAVEEFGIGLFESGLADGLVLLGQSLEVVAAAAGGLLQLTSALNDATDGWAGRVAGLAASLFVLNKTLRITANLYKEMAASQALQRLTAGGSFLGRQPVYGPPTPAGLGGPGQGPGPGAVGLVGGARGFIAANAAGLTLIAAAVAKGLYDTAKSDMKEGVEHYRGQVQAALAKGIDPNEILRIAKEGQAGLSLPQRAALSALGQPDILGTTKDEIAEFLSEIRAKQLEAVLKAQEKAGAEIALYKPPAATGRQGPLGDPSRTQELGAEFVKQLRDNTASEFTRTVALQYIEDASSILGIGEEIAEIRAAWERELRGILTEEQKSKAALARLTSESRQASLQELRIAVEEGSILPDALIARLQQDIADTETTIVDVRKLIAAADEDDVEELLKQLQTLLDARKALVDEVAKVATEGATRLPDLRIRIRDALNLPGADEANLAEVQGIIAALEGLDPQEQLERVFQGISLLQSIAEAAEKTSFKIPPEFQKVIATSLLPELANSPEGAQIAQRLGISINNLTHQLTQAIAAVGLDAGRIARVLLEGRRQMLEATKAELVNAFDFRKFQALREREAELNEAAAAIEGQITGALDSLFGSVPQTGYTSPDKKDPEDLRRAIAEAQLAIRRAQANNDPVLLARLSIEAADIQARFAKNEAERLQAIAARIEAQNQLAAAEADIPQALRELAQAMNTQDAVKQTGYARDAAHAAVNLAQGTAARLRAEAARVQADQAARDAIRDVYTAQQELLIAIANAAGDTVKAAVEQLAIARRNLQNLTRDQAGQAEMDRGKAEVVAATAALRDAKFQTQLGDIEFLLEMERISIQQAIAMLQRLAQIPGATAEMIRTIERRIKQLRDELNQDLAFNLPDIRLPTLYEVRRLMQSGEPAGTGAYQDNRQVDLTLHISSNVDAGPVIAQIAELVGAPPTLSTYAGIY